MITSGLNFSIRTCFKRQPLQAENVLFIDDSIQVINFFEKLG